MRERQTPRPMVTNPASTLRETERLVTERTTQADRQVGQLLADLREVLSASGRSNLAEEQARELKNANQNSACPSANCAARVSCRNDSARAAIFESRDITWWQDFASLVEENPRISAVCLNCRLDDATLVCEIRKPFDVLAEGLISEKSRGDRRWTFPNDLANERLLALAIAKSFRSQQMHFDQPSPERLIDPIC